MIESRRNQFATAAVDNLDHNPTSTTARDAFHGTGTSLFQNRHIESDGIENLKLEKMPSNKPIPTLPDLYTNLTPVVLKKEEPTIPALNGFWSVNKHAVSKSTWRGKEVEHKHSRNNDQRRPDYPKIQSRGLPSIRDSDFGVTIITLLPLFPDDSKSVAMIRHPMAVIQRAVEFLDPGQVPVLTVDQPLFAIAKRIQWEWPDTHMVKKGLSFY